MASGCILGDCPVCGDLIYEDEWDIIDDIIIHEDCKKQYIQDKYGMSEEQLQQLCEAQELKRDIEDTERELQHSMKYFLQQINVLKKRLEAVERGK